MKSVFKNIAFSSAIIIISITFSMIAGMIEQTVKYGWHPAALFSNFVFHDLFYLLYPVSAQITFVVAILIFYRIITGNKTGSLGIIKPKAKEVYKSMFAGFAIILIGFLLLISFQSVSIISLSFDFSNFLFSILIYINVAVYEEIVFRGFLITRFKEIMSEKTTLVISSLLFLVAHSMNPNMTLLSLVNIFLGGFVLGMLFIYYKSIWEPIAFHFIWNFSMGPLFGFNVSGFECYSLITVASVTPDIINGGYAGFEGSILCTFLLIAYASIINYKYYKINEKK